ncbi:class I SAM-dependent methyltransferase [Leuconostoc carnosum]|uniref:class I SAM-dependent methyltransferase n=1 Tax=Leuconostoc carnosum TaxID=1252 RepID=UPI00345CB23C
MAKNLFSDASVANQFNQYNDVLEQTLGYHYVISAFESDQANKILDYGCGPGKVSFRLANQWSSDIIAVDESAKMIEIANDQRAHEHIEYRIVENDNLNFIADNSIDGAMACYVFINNESEQRILQIMSEIHRVLRPKSRFLILDTNPNTTGVSFSTFQNGEKGKKYGYGEPRIEKLHVDQNNDLILHDFNWPNSMYENNLRKAGFRNINVRYPKLNDLTAEERIKLEKTYQYNNWSNEQAQSPFILYQAIKDGSI